jgi:hypothetical protein
MNLRTIERSPLSSFKRNIWLYNQGDFDEYRRLLSLTDWESIFSTDDIDKITTDISNTILSAAEAIIPNKFVTIRKQDPSKSLNIKLLFFSCGGMP